MLMLLCAVATFAQVNSELTGKKISIGEAATEVVDGQWYILNNVGRGNYVSEETNIMKMRATSTCENGSLATNKAGYLFKFTKVEGDNEYWNIVSGNGKYFACGDNTSSISNAAVNYLIGHQDAENAPNVFYLIDTESGFVADGQGTNDRFVGYGKTAPTAPSGNNAYRLLPVTFEENVVDYASLNSAISAVNETLVNGGYTITLGDAVALQIDNADASGYLSVSHQACDEDVLANAIDDSKSTLYHSSWVAAVATPYMQVDLGEDGKLDAFMLNYSTRQSGNNAAPYAMTVSASNDGENFTTITKLSKEDAVNALPASNAKDYSAFFIADQAYRYLRFTVTSSPNSNNSFGVASFGIQKATVEGEKSGLHMRYATIFKAMNDAKSLLALGNNADQSDVNAAATNLTDFVARIRLTAAPFETTTDFENPVCYLMKSARAEDNWTNPYWKYDTNGIVINEYSNAKDIVTDENAYWFFVEDDKTGALTLYAAADASSSMGYIAVNDGANKITNNATKVGSAYQLVIKDGSAHPYALRPYGKNNYVSNHSGRGKRMGFYNNLNDTGTRFALVKKEDVVVKTDAFTWDTNTTWTDAKDLASTALNDNALVYGIKYIETEVVADDATKAVVTFQYTGGSCALNTRGVEVIDANGNIVAGDYHVGKTGTNSTGNVYTVKVAKAGTYTVRCYATFNSDNRAGDTNGNITVNHTLVDESTFSHNVTFAAEYATLHLGYQVAVPAGVEAYVVSSIENGLAKMTKVEGVIPAATPVILKNLGTENTYTFAYTTDDAAAVEKNLLKGSIVNRYVIGDAYVLTLKNNEVCFGGVVLNQLDGTAFLNNANKVYLPASVASGAASYSFAFGDGTTGVEEVKGENEEVKAIFDLTGRKVEAITAPGIYIVNGKKVLVK